VSGTIRCGMGTLDGEWDYKVWCGNKRCGVGTTLGGKWEQHWMGSESIRWGVETRVRSGTMGGVWKHG
jgi:hypothetical protein